MNLMEGLTAITAVLIWYYALQTKRMAKATRDSARATEVIAEATGRSAEATRELAQSTLVVAQEIRDLRPYVAN